MTTLEIADAFLVPPADDGAASRAREAQDPQRRDSVRRAAASRSWRSGSTTCAASIYLIFNEGYAATSGEQLVRADLCSEAIRLARVLAALMPQEPEVMGLLALLLYHDSRRAARTERRGRHRHAWQPRIARCGITGAIAEANQLLSGSGASPQHRSLSARGRDRGRTRPRASADRVDWPAIVLLYDRLCALAPSPVAALNRAVAISYARGPLAGSAALDALPQAELERYHLYHVARADALRRLGDTAGARSAYERALERAQHPSEQAFLRRTLADYSPVSDS